MSSPRITHRDLRVVKTETCTDRYGCCLRRLIYEDRTSALFWDDVRVVGLHWVGAIPRIEEPPTNIYELVLENGLRHGIETTNDGAKWLSKSFIPEAQR